LLTDAQPERWREKLQECLHGGESIRSCMALKWSLRRHGAEVTRGCAVNDVVLSRGALSRLVCLEISVDGQSMGALRADGIIVSTPVGSSGYSVSAGGSLLHPSMEALAVTPICPFLHTISPMVFPGESSCTLHILQGSTDCYLTVDGQEGHMLELGDTVTIAGLPSAVHFMGEGANFFERLRSRGFVLRGTAGEEGGGKA
jgi:NAD+ kinase